MLKKCYSLVFKLKVLIAIFIVVYIYSNNIYCFLSPSEPIKADILVVEGWLPELSLKIASELIKANRYHVIIVTGGPLDQGSFLSEYKTYAEVGRAILDKITFRENIVAVSAPLTIKDRTYASAIALKKYFYENSVDLKRVDLVSLDVHGRRSWFLFKKALGENYSVGIISICSTNCKSFRWWAYSQEFKKVIGETIAYIYTIVLSAFLDELSN
jgi:hypothetical protein